ncbi:MAG: DUF6306 domain-containing protein [bacterium]|nr:DUF6306 domain-containing protein [bacterium]
MSVSMELRERLVALLEAERAGVVVAKKMLAESSSGEETALFETILAGEKDGCRALGKAILDLGVAGSGSIGDFVGKVMALPGKIDRLNLLIKGQEWVVRKLDEVLESELPAIDREALQKVRNDHVVNIEKCRQFLD